MTTDTGLHSAGQRARTATLAAASLGFAVIQLDVFVVNVGVKQIGASLGEALRRCSGWSGSGKQSCSGWPP